jgi:hypothetical protein
MRLTPQQEEALAVQERSTQRHARATQAQKDATARSIADALASLRLGTPPTRVARASPFTGSYIRKLARDAGIEGDPKYDRTAGRS